MFFNTTISCLRYFLCFALRGLMTLFLPSHKKVETVDKFYYHALSQYHGSYAKRLSMIFCLVKNSGQSLTVINKQSRRRKIKIKTEFNNINIFKLIINKRLARLQHLYITIAGITSLSYLIKYRQGLVFPGWAKGQKLCKISFIIKEGFFAKFQTCYRE